MRDFQADIGERLLGALDALGGGRAVVDERQLHVVQGGGAGQQIEGLEDEADFLVADARKLIVVEITDQLAVQPIAALGRRIEAADEVHQRGLAGAGRSHDGDILVVADLQRDSAQSVHLLLRAHVVGAPQIFDDNHVVRVPNRGCGQFLDADAIQCHVFLGGVVGVSVHRSLITHTVPCFSQLPLLVMVTGFSVSRLSSAPPFRSRKIL